MKINIKNKLMPLGIILAISVFFVLSFTESTQACFQVINVTTNLEAATFTINGPVSYSGSGTSWSVSGIPGGIYSIVYGDVEGYVTPSSESKTLIIFDGNGAITFTGFYEKLVINKKKNIIVGAGPGSRNTGLVKVFNHDGTETGVSFIAHKYKYGVNVASGDIDGDGRYEIITGVGPGPQNPAEVNVYFYNGNHTGLRLIAHEYKYGVNVASADFDGDGRYEVITGAGPGPQNPAEVKVFVYDPTEQKLVDSGIDFLAYNTKYGVKVAAGDVDGDGTAEIITERGSPTYKGDIKRWMVDTSSGIGRWSVSLIKEGPRYTLKDDFDNSKDLEWDEVSGIWSAEGGQYSMIGVVAETIGLSVIDIETQDMTIEVDASELGDNDCYQNFFIVFAYDEADAMVYWAGARVGADRWSIEKMDYAFGNRSKTIDETPEVIDTDTFYRLKVVVRGDSVTLYADGVKKLSYTFPDGIPTGRIGLGGNNNRAYFDNFSVAIGSLSEPDYGYSVNIASADIDGDGIDEIITGAGSRPNAPDEIKVINEDGTYLSEFRAGVYNHYGANVASVDMDGDGVAEIITGAGPGPDNEAFVQIFNVNAFNVYGKEEKAYLKVLDTKYGVNVAAGYFGF